MTPPCNIGNVAIHIVVDAEKNTFDASVHGKVVDIATVLAHCFRTYPDLAQAVRLAQTVQPILNS